MLLSGGLSTLAQAAEISSDPGDYIPLPAGTDLLALYLQNSQHDAYYSDGKKLPADLAMEANVGVFRYVHFMELAGVIINPQVVIPFGHVELEKSFGGLPQTTSSGIGDPMIATSAWLYNNPSTGRYMAVLATAALPLGEYDGDKGPINLGQNRWRGIFQAAYVTPLTQRSLLELVTEYAVYGKNDDYFGMTQRRDDSYGVQTHLSYAPLPGSRIGLSYFHDFAGETELDGIAQGDELNGNRWLVSASTSLAPGTQLLVQYGESIKVENGAFESQRVNMRLVKLF